MYSMDPRYSLPSPNMPEAWEANFDPSFLYTNHEMRNYTPPRYFLFFIFTLFSLTI